MLGSELQAKLVELGYSRQGVSADPRYDVWVRANSVPGRLRKVYVPNSLLVDDFAAERILADAAR